MNNLYIAIMVLGYVGLSAARDVWLHRYLSFTAESLSDYLLLTFLPVSFVMALVWLTGKGKDKGKDSAKSPYSPEARRDLLFLNFTTAATWMLVYASLTLAHARTADAVGLALVPLFTLVMRKSLANHAWACLAIVTGCVILSWNEISAPFVEYGGLAVLGLAAAIVGGVFAAANIIFSRKLGKLGVTPHGIFGARFWLLVVVAGVWSVGHRIATPVSSSADDASKLWFVPLVGLGGIVIPLYVFQRLISVSGRIASFIVPLVPVAVFFLEAVVEEESVFSMAGLGVVVATVGIYYGMRPPPHPVPALVSSKVAGQ